MEFSQIALLLVVSGLFGVVAKALKQPLLIGYLFAGFLLGVTGLVHETATLTSLSQIGVTLLLFLLGLEMKVGELSSIGKVALITGLGQIFFTSAIGFLIALALGFGILSSVYIAIALTFSSTIIMVKLLSEKKDLSSLYGKISVGFLLVQDFVAVFILMFLAGVGEGGMALQDYLFIGLKGILLIVLVWILSKKVLPKIFEKYVANSTELLFIVSIAWALGVATFVAGPLGFTLEIGGFLAGLALSNLPEHLEIASRTRPLRDFFLTIFFLLLGTKLVIGGSILAIVFPATIFSLFVLVGNPLIVMAIMGFLGYRKRTSFMAGLTVAQISEFSLILVTMGLSLGHLSQDQVAMVVMVGVVTMTASTYLILGSENIYEKIKEYLKIFEKKKPKENVYITKKALENHVVLVGSDRTGKTLTSHFIRENTPFVVVDFNPEIFKKLNANNTPVVFGDINDPEIMEAASIINAKTVVSTIGNLPDNLKLLEYLKKANGSSIKIFTAATKDEAIQLYEKGADFVTVPEIVAGEHIKHVFSTYGIGSKKIVNLGKNHFNRLIFK
jgi:Kef-type K+ transport system membrane component KefB/voltage-gated potassium channel Kch